MEASVAPPVVRDADGRAQRSALTSAATRAVTRDAAERAARPAEAPSAHLAGLLDHLRTTVECYVRERRAAGAPVERVLPEVKGLVREAAACEAWYDPAETLVRHVVGWAIAAYYAGPQPPERGQEGPQHVPDRR